MKNWRSVTLTQSMSQMFFFPFVKMQASFRLFTHNGFTKQLLTKFHLLRFYFNVHTDAICEQCPPLQTADSVPVRVCACLHDAVPILQSRPLGSGNFTHSHVHQLRAGKQSWRQGGEWWDCFICTDAVNNPAFVSPPQSFRWTWAIDLARWWSRTCSAATATWREWRSATPWTHRCCSRFARSLFKNVTKKNNKKNNSTLRS